MAVRLVGLVFFLAVVLGCSKTEEIRRPTEQPNAAGSDSAGSGNSGGTSGEGAGGAGAAGGLAVDPSESELHVRFEDAEGIAIDVVTLGCDEECVEVRAVPRGGNAPYALAWDDGSTDGLRRACAGDELSVSVRDTSIDAEEFEYEAQAVDAVLPVIALECGDGGTCEPGPGSDTPESGHYEGTGTYVCDNDMSAESAALINHLVVSLDFEIDPSEAVQGGHAFFQWGLVLIAGEGLLEGELECGGALRASLHEGLWGLPGPDPNTVIPTGTVTGEFTARRTQDEGTITGSWHWTSMTPVGEYGNMCNGTYEAKKALP